MLRLLDRLEEVLIASLIAAGDGADLPVSVTHRYALGLPADVVGLVPSPRLDGASAPRSRSIYFALRAINLVWAQELTHHPVRLDGQVRRGLRGAHRHPRRHRRADQPAGRRGAAPVFILFGLLAGALFTGIIATLGANFVWHMYACLGDLARSGTADVAGLPRHSAGVGADVLPLPAGGLVGFRRTGELPQHDHGHVDGL